MGIVLTGLAFFEVLSVTIDVKNRLLQLPEISIQRGQKSKNKDLNSFIDLQMTQKMVKPPFQQLMLPARCEATYAPTNGAVEATPAFERRDALLVSPALVTLTEGKTML